ncbi:MAG: phosphatase PAP2 family protein [Phycisphaerae bacterium]
MSSIETYVRNESRPEFAGQPLRFKPLLATPWGRALIAGIFVGMIPLVTVIWVFFDKQFANQFTQKEWEQWVFLRSLGLLGDALPWICLSAFILLMGIFGKRRDIATWAVFLCLSIAASGAVVNLVKFMVMRTRPNWHGAIPDGGSFSFPSGHAATIGAVAVVCVLRWPKSLPLALTLVALVALNRVVSQIHHITDVIVGAVVGMISALVVQWCWWKYQPGTFADMHKPVG